MVRVTIVLLTLMSVLLPSVALAEKRIALLIGNKDYKPGAGALLNPLNDVRVVSDALKAVGFEVLKPAQNATRAAMLLAVYDFAARLKAAGPEAVGFLYYSGHGIASAGENYLIPVDIDEPSTRLLSVAGVKQSEVLAILRNEAPNAAHYLVLDACRNTLQGARGGKGFIPVGQQSGVLVAFSTEPGKTASDTGRASGPYAAALAAELVKPRQSDLIMFHNVRIAVMDKTHGDQVPWTEDGIQRRERVQFGPSASPEELAWQVLEDASKRSASADSARTRLEELKKQEVAVVTPPAQPVATKENPIFYILPHAGPCTRPEKAFGGVETQVGSEVRCLKATDSFKDCADCPEMVVIPPGRFMMGSPKDEPERSEGEDQVSITIAKPFAVGRFAVTRGEFAAFAASTGHKTDGGCWAYCRLRVEGAGGSQLALTWLLPE
jgi:caspase domain-containing protein/sulfatase-modifying factor enzyme 1